MTSPDTVIVVDTEAANVASVCAALKRCSVEPQLSSSCAEIESARRLILPGVGAFGTVMKRLVDLGLNDLLRERIETGRPTLAICLGLQVFATSSEESPEVAGLGIIDDTVARFGPGLRVPQLGWNQVKAGSDCSLLRDGAAYFANSFRLKTIPNGWNGATADHGGTFVAGLEKGLVLACQFHPELSGRWGEELIDRWLTASEVV